MNIINLTQHPATPVQRAAGVRDMHGEDLESLRAALTFDYVPSRDDLRNAARFIANLATDFELAMIGGAPFLMESLARELRLLDVEPVYAFSVRESVEETGPDGAVHKRAVFRHVGFVRPDET